MTVRHTGSMLTALAMLGGCGFNRADHATQTCRLTSECEMGQECSSGFCISIEAGSGGTGGSGGSGGGGVCTGTITEPCYDGTDGTQDHGVCRGGERLCVSGQWSQCLGQVVDSDEQCNGRDDDCDNEVDEIDQLACDTTMLGECAVGQVRCVGALGICQQVTARAEETCDTLDNDCDGKVDEDTDSVCYPATEGCTVTEGTYRCSGVCGTGARQCGGSVDACPGAIVPTTESCTDDGGSPLDEDCDGQVDEQCACTGDGARVCYGGPDGTQGIGACMAGSQQCDGSVWGDCDGDRGPAFETCGNPGVDNDCDGVLDDVFGAGTFCVDDSKQGDCRTGSRACVNGALRCVTAVPATEVCDTAQRDEDCDGQVNEGFVFATDENNCGSCGNVCGDGQTCCAGQCVDLSSDPSACGSCDNSCGGASCCSGHCKDTTTATTDCGGCGIACDTAQSCCGSCTNTDADTNNCGACGHACESNQFCCGGGCQDTSCSCSQCSNSGGTCCDESCTDTATDEQNCGGCGVSCDNGERCLDGHCCAAGTINCGGTCVAAATDEQNCGGCGVSCGNGQDCCGGTCTDLGTSAFNCGGCGVLCASPSSCSSGLCCGAGATNCGNGCVDTMNSEQDCGACGEACDQGETCCSGKCRDLYRDNRACGSCAGACGLVEQCCQGDCLRSGTTSGTNTCECAQDCGELSCCGTACVDIMNDTNNCGGCGISCGSGGPLDRACCNGQCTTGFCITPI